MHDIDWESAITTRRSIRSYEMRPVEADTMAKLKDFAAAMPVPFQHDVRVRFFQAEPSRRLYGGLVTSPPDHAAFVSRTDTLSISRAGFIGELFILYATAMGLSTCWYGGYSLAELERLMPHLDGAAAGRLSFGYGKGAPPGERAICITPLAYHRMDGARVYERLAGGLLSHKRKPLADLLADGVSAADLPPDLLHALELARIAPSGRNGQYWRFTVSHDLRTVSVALPVGHRDGLWPHPNVDIGICACHVWLGLKVRGIESGLRLVEDDGRAIWEFTL